MRNESDPQTPKRHEIIADVSSWILRGGVILSAAVMLIGIAISFIHGTVSLDRMRGQTPNDGFEYQPSVIVHGIANLHGKYIIEAGIYILLFTPIARVAASMLIFAFVDKDRLYAVITFIVLALTLGGLLLLG